MKLFQNSVSLCLHTGKCSGKKEVFTVSFMNCDFFTRIFISKQCLEPNPYPNFYQIRIQPKPLELSAGNYTMHAVLRLRIRNKDAGSATMTVTFGFS
jgi:hypothetical protein